LPPRNRRRPVAGCTNPPAPPCDLPLSRVTSQTHPRPSVRSPGRDGPSRSATPKHPCRVAFLTHKVSLLTDKTTLLTDKATLLTDRMTLSIDGVILSVDGMTLSVRKVILSVCGTTLRVEGAGVSIEEAVVSVNRMTLLTDKAAKLTGKAGGPGFRGVASFGFVVGLAICLLAAGGCCPMGHGQFEAGQRELFDKLVHGVERAVDDAVTPDFGAVGWRDGNGEGWTRSLPLTRPAACAWAHSLRRFPSASDLCGRPIRGNALFGSWEFGFVTL
jgi:hypothetical protein